MSNINVSQQNFKPTLDKRDRTEHGENHDKDFSQTVRRHNVELQEVDQMLNEKTKSLKKQIWDLAKMEALVHGDQKLSAIYNEMSQDGEEKYGYHYNETIMNIIFNEYVLNSVKYLAKYKSAVPVEKKRRDKTGINKLQKKGDEKQDKKDAAEVDEVVTHNNSLTGVQSDDIDPDITEMTDNNGNRRDEYGDENDRGYLNHRIEKQNYPTTPNTKPDWDDNIDETTGAVSSGGYAAKAVFDPHNDNDEVMYENMSTLNEKAESEAQQKLMDMAYAYKKGEMDDATDKVKELANSMSMENLKDFASTKHDDIPAKKKTDEGEEIDETTTSASSGSYETPYAFAQGKARHSKKPAYPDGEIIDESYLTNPDTFRLIYESLEIDEDTSKDCWGGYKKVGTKKGKDGKTVNDCVPIDEDNHDDSLVPNAMEEDEMTKSYTHSMGALEEHHLDTHQEKSEFLSQILGGDMQTFLAMPEEVVDQLYQAYENEMMGESIIDDQPDSMAATMADVNPPMMEENKKCRDGEIPNPNKEKEDDPNCVRKDSYYEKKREDKSTNSNKKKKGLQTKDRFNLETRKKREQEYQQKLKQKKSKQNEMKYNKELEENSQLMETLKKLSAGETISEDTKHPSMVNLDRLRKDNEKNFKGEMKDSNSTEIAADQGEAETASEQYTDIDDPQELSQKIEKDKLSQHDGESFDNEGDSTNDSNDEIPKRNRTKEEQEEIALNRGYGMEALDYDLEPSDRFKERAKKDMGEKYYELGQDKVKQRNDQVMYNKDQQPVEDEDKYDKKMSEISENVITGKYRDENNQTQFINFNISKTKRVDSIDESFVKLNLDGLGNTYMQDMHENSNMRNVMDSFEFYLNKSSEALTPIVAVKRQNRQLMAEGEEKTQQPINEGLEKMKKLWGYKPSKYVNTHDTKKNRGF